MQVLKKIALFFLVFGLFGCNSRMTDNRIEISNQRYDIIDYDVIDRTMKEADSLNVAVLLPLTGKASSIGLGMQNAMFMALDDAQNKRLVLKFYDTKSTAEGANIAAEKAIREGAQMILGPLMSDEVSGISNTALMADVPVVSFTTSPQVLQKGIYSIGLLNGEQIDTIITYAASKERTKLALLVPNNSGGLNIVKSAMMASQSKGVSLVKVGFYNPNSVDFASLIKDMSVSANFDAVLIADSGNRLKSIASSFAYNDVMYPNVLFMGTSAWDNTNLSKETMLYHGVYPMVSKSYASYFNDKYKETFGEAPKDIYSFAYDGVQLASLLASKGADNLEEKITSRNGFIGVNGFFKILPTGQSRHSLDILEVTKDGTQAISKIDGKKSDYDEEPVNIKYIPYEQLPRFYGKNSSEVLRWLYDN